MTSESKHGGIPLPVFLTAGFRFYFLAAGAFAVIGLAGWLVWLAVHAMGGAFTRSMIEMPPHLWHAHEMLFGYTVAVIAGFFLTAVPNWTGAAQARALYVAGTGAVWLAGRLAIWFSGALDPYLVAIVDLAFIPLLGIRIGGNLLKRPQARNLFFLVLLIMLFAGNLRMHLDWIGLPGGDAEAGVRLGLLTSVAMIVIIGGRVIPGFTRNALNRRGYGGAMPTLNPHADRVAMASSVLLALLSGFDTPEVVLGVVASIAAVANAVRLSGWRGMAVWREPILWSLHLAFAMLVLGYAALALAHLGGPLGEIPALHLLAIGAVGGMTLAMMTRASLGHTGRNLVVSKPIALAYLAVAVAGVTRMLGPVLLPGEYYQVMFISGGLWVAAFVLFLWVYVPILGQRSR